MSTKQHFEILTALLTITFIITLIPGLVLKSRTTDKYGVTLPVDTITKNKKTGKKLLNVAIGCAVGIVVTFGLASKASSTGSTKYYYF